MSKDHPERSQLSASLPDDLTDRQKREITYHKEHTQKNRDNQLRSPILYDIVTSKARRWWNATWEMYTVLLQHELSGKRVLVIGCGFGKDALCFAKVGADVDAIDLSSDVLDVAKALAEREELSVSFNEMSAENLQYQSDTFDYVVARDILHHVDIPKTMSEVQRVSKKGALFVASEIYTHSVANNIRNSTLVEKVMYPKMRDFVHRGNVYITEDERKLNEADIRQIIQVLDPPISVKYFDFIVNRLFPDKWPFLAKIDRLLLLMLSPVARFLGGRVFFVGCLKK